MWRFRCADNGIGIDPAYAERIFVIFQRLHARSAFAGTGIGLAMCRKIVEYHGGRMWLETDRGPTGPGSTFCFTLPATAEDE
jgi:light-regulated signal transduction histidine kinase (bacteriophytochrome)